MICKNPDCTNPITKASSSGLCKSCAVKISVARSNRVCKNPQCRRPIKISNKLGECYRCRIYKRKPANFNKGSSWHKDQKHICFRCKQPFRGRKNQHPTQSFCPGCKAAVDHIAGGSNWVDMGIFRNG